MLELNRLKAMPDNYDQKLFNHLYYKTENLRRKLASEIDSRRFGLSKEDVLSFFDVKFIFVFSKHHELPENILLGYLLNSLKNFKARILRSAYTQKYSQSIMSIDNLTFDYLSDPIDDNTKDTYFEKIMVFMKKHLSLNAYTILDLQMNPPPYIYHKLNTSPDTNLRKIPDHIILDYLDLGSSPKAFKYIEGLKKEIRNATKYAKEIFKNPIA